MTILRTVTTGARVLETMVQGARAAVVLVAVLLPFARIDGAVVNFNSPGDTTTYFNATGAPKFSESISGGLSGTASVVANSTNTTGALVTKASISGGAATENFTASIYFRFETPTSPSTGRFLTLGLTNAPDFDLGGPSPSYVELSLGKLFFGSNNITASSGTVTGGNRNTASSPVGLSDGNWYKLIIDGTWNPSVSRYGIRFRILASDAAGSELPLTPLLDGSTTASSGIDSEGPIYAFIGSSGPAANIGFGAVDNFEYSGIVVPEPGSCAMLPVGAIALMGRRRRSALS